MQAAARICKNEGLRSQTNIKGNCCRISVFANAYWGLGDGFKRPQDVMNGGKKAAEFDPNLHDMINSRGFCRKRAYCETFQQVHPVNVPWLWNLPLRRMYGKSC
jgi:hypothetical protein